eukprot:gene53981-59456_t
MRPTFERLRVEGVFGPVAATHGYVDVSFYTTERMMVLFLPDETSGALRWFLDGREIDDGRVLSVVHVDGGGTDTIVGLPHDAEESMAAMRRLAALARTCGVPFADFAECCEGRTSEVGVTAHVISCNPGKDTVLTLKHKMLWKTGIPLMHQQLRYKMRRSMWTYEELENDGARLEDYGIDASATLLG